MENVNIKFHHIGVAVFSFSASVPFYESIGYKKMIEIYDPEQNVEVCVLTHETSPCLELLAPHDEKSPINNMLKKSGASPYHVCYQVEDIEKQIVHFRKEGFLQISMPKVSNAFSSHLVCFMIKKDIGLIELMQIK